MNKDKDKRIEDMCTYCGMKQVRSKQFGRPSPGTCNKRSNSINGKKWPHKWIINRTL